MKHTQETIEKLKIINKMKALKGRFNPAWRGGRKQVLACKTCGSLFESWIYRKRQYCSYNCKRLSQIGKIPWNKGRGFLGDQDKALKDSVVYKKWRITVLKRDDYTCQICFKRGGNLQVDHIRPFVYFPESRLDLSNGRALCLPCHRGTESFGSKAYSKKYLSKLNYL